jgi:excisionase family DNA binding protein
MCGPKLPRISRAPLLTAAQVAEILNVNLRSVRRLIKAGKLPIVRIGRAVRIRPETLAALIEQSDPRSQNMSDDAGITM